MAERVLSLTTIGTPHRGSSFADWSVRRFGSFLQPVLDLLSLPCQAFFDLTVSSCQKFNEEVPDQPGVRYFSVAGRFQCGWYAPEWSLPASVLSRTEGANDGVVSVSSATYGESCEVWEADHLNLVNWFHPLRPCKSRIPDYGRLIGRLADEGF
jgi:triacylglycerol lipase